MTEPAPVTLSATLAADEALARRRAAGEQVLMMASGEIGLPVLPELRARLAAAVGEASYGPVAGSPALRAAAAGYWRRRGLAADPDAVVAGPGSKSLLFAAVKAIGGDVVVPRPSWVSYAAQAALAGAAVLRVPVRPGQGGVPDPDALREAVRAARAAGRDPRSVVVTLPDNPTGNVAAPDTVRQLAEAARELDLFVISDEIYTDLVHDPDTRAASPALFAPERTVVTGGLTKNLAVGGWRTGIALLPPGPAGRRLRERLVAVASQIWSSPRPPSRPPPPTPWTNRRRSPPGWPPPPGCTDASCGPLPSGSPPPGPCSTPSARPATSTRTSNRCATGSPPPTACAPAPRWPGCSPTGTASGCWPPRSSARTPGRCGCAPPPAGSTATPPNGSRPRWPPTTRSACPGSGRPSTGSRRSWPTSLSRPPPPAPPPAPPSGPLRARHTDQHRRNRR
ncbi:pyridoxal phosphate-dependent aminotransferase [Kitasatospora saccharophila]|uniref:pyridoxal phosphate-dependent aminotransferase n=1 Tax=Kitasatospora saccharophila TaxID=407973 RepID=UPI00363D5008